MGAISSAARGLCLVVMISAAVGCEEKGLTSATARITVLPRAIDFGDSTIGVTQQRAVVISNIGTGPLSISDLELTQSVGTQFTCEGCKAVSVAPSDSVTVIVRFTPDRVGAASGSLTVLSDASNSGEVLVSLSAIVASTCVPTTCAAKGHTCGSLGDGCGGSLECGSCIAPSVCGSNGVCACTAESEAAFCARLGKNCGAASAQDSCGVVRSVASCGVCTQTCGVSGVCGCVAETDAALCTRVGAACGELTTFDNCGASRTVASCGGCTSPASCGGGGTANQCGCAESDAAFCARLGKACGPVSGIDLCGTARTVTSCGTCSGTGVSCGAVTPGQCGCAVETDAALCARSGASCGPLSVTDTCGTPRSIASCGTCTATGASCGAGVCSCTPELDAAFCSRLGKACGSATAADNCGVSRTVASCGTCTGTGASCGGGGTAGQCGCTEADAAFCARTAAVCGAVSGVDVCGVARTVSSCGACGVPQTCSANLCTGCRYGPLYGPASTTNSGQRVFDSSGRLLMLDFRGGLLRVPAGGGTVTTLVGPSSVGSPNFRWFGTPLVRSDGSALLTGYNGIYRCYETDITKWADLTDGELVGGSLLEDSNGQIYDSRRQKVFSVAGTLVADGGVPHSDGASLLLDEKVIDLGASFVRSVCFDDSAAASYSSFSGAVRGLARGADGSIYFGISEVSQQSAPIFRIPPGGGTPVLLTTIPGLEVLSSLAANLAGTELYVSGDSSSSPNTVWKVTMATGDRVVYGCYFGGRACGSN